jgi:stage II sporulation protein D
MVTFDPQHGLAINGNRTQCRSLVVVPEESGSLKAGDIHYRGAFEIHRSQKGSLHLVNVVDLEHYLAGVLFSEMPASFPEEALKAQVVAARTYALYRRAGENSTLTADTYSQVYGGMSTETPRSAALVDATWGEVLVYDKKILPAFFSSTCGGISARAKDAFTGSAPAPVNHNRPCAYCTHSPSYAWSVSFADEEIIKKLDLPKDLKGLDLVVTGFDTARRAVKITVLNRQREMVAHFTAETFRRKLNRGSPRKNRLLSTLIDGITRGKGLFLIDGRGWGHGVGLCQYGAEGLAREGKSYEQILNYYYPGATLTSNHGGLK